MGITCVPAAGVQLWLMYRNHESVLGRDATGKPSNGETEGPVTETTLDPCQDDIHIV